MDVMSVILAVFWVLVISWPTNYETIESVETIDTTYEQSIYQWISDEIIKNNWITLDLVNNENLAWKAYYAIAAYPELSVVINKKDFSDEKVLEYVKNNSKVLQEEWKTLWSWVDWDLVYLDVSIVIPKDQKEKAFEILKQYKERPMYDLELWKDVHLLENWIK